MKPEFINNVSLAQERIIKVAVIEENAKQAKLVRDVLHIFAKDRKYEFYVHVVDDVVSFISDYRGGYDILFISVEHPVMGGIAIANKLRRYDEDVLIFLSSHTKDAAIEGYGVQAFTYLLKNTDYYSVSVWLSAAVERIMAKPITEHVIVTSEKIHRLQIEGIQFIEIRGHQLCFHTTTNPGGYCQRGKMSDIEATFATHGFFRINRSYLINLHYVTSVHGNEVTVGGTIITIGRTRKREFRKQLDKVLRGTVSAKPVVNS